MHLAQGRPEGRRNLEHLAMIPTAVFDFKRVPEFPSIVEQQQLEGHEIEESRCPRTRLMNGQARRVVTSGSCWAVTGWFWSSSARSNEATTLVALCLPKRSGFYCRHRSSRERRESAESSRKCFGFAGERICERANLAPRRATVDFPTGGGQEFCPEEGRRADGVIQGRKKEKRERKITRSCARSYPGRCAGGVLFSSPWPRGKGECGHPTWLSLKAWDWAQVFSRTKVTCSPTAPAYRRPAADGPLSAAFVRRAEGGHTYTIDKGKKEVRFEVLDARNRLIRTGRTR